MTFNQEKKTDIRKLKEKLMFNPSEYCGICNNCKMPGDESEIRIVCQKCGLDSHFTSNIMVSKL